MKTKMYPSWKCIPPSNLGYGPGFYLLILLAGFRTEDVSCYVNSISYQNILLIDSLFILTVEGSY